MLARMEAKEQLGESRWKVLTYPRAFIKIVQLVLPIIAVGLSISFNQVAYINDIDENAWFNISVKFPFHYDNKTATYTNDTVPPNFVFGQQVEICSWLFVGCNGAWFLMALAILLAYLKVHGGEKMEKVATLDGFFSCTLAIIGFTLTSLWLYSIIDLRKTVHVEIDFVYNGPSKCRLTNTCKKHYPSFLFLYLACGIGFISAILWCASIIIALKYSFRSKYASQSGIGGILEMSTDMLEELK